MANTPWQRLLHFVSSREPQFRPPPPPPDQLKRLYECSRTSIPTVVHELLSSVGHESDFFRPFGNAYITSIEEFLQDPDYQCLADRFFRVAIAYDPQRLGVGDLYVDTLQSDGYDAPLITLGTSWHGELPPPGGHTILSNATRSAFTQLQLRRSPFCGYIAEHINAPESLSTYIRAMDSLAKRMSLPKPIESPRPEMQFYATDDFSLFFDGIGPGIRRSPLLTIDLGVPDAKRFLELADQIRTWMPPLSIMHEWR